MTEQAISADRMTDDALMSFHKFMIEAVLKVENIAPLAMRVWSDTLKELDKRGKVRLVSGSYDDIGNALIQTL